ncbi:MAG TPA: hypothetical protein VLF18_21400 [Tahibacter sp.]|uniref:hypothetical protein n=1 Tax=Tahibacter sp. TaxID=2056211 RepID=UPI002C1B164C|nr:hypothetical protein [Tahibacter sp.]HSX62747.1 hypothetical protein [Tahibacter sp.]
MTQRQITLVNNSTSPTSLAVVQNANEQGGVVAWLVRYVYPGAQVRFTWNDTDYCFVWSGSGQISPGVVIDASQTVSTSLNEGNLIALSYDSKNRTFYFHDQQDAPQMGTLVIRADSSLPVNAVAAGIGMSGKPTLVMQGQPNMNYVFTPRTSYALAFGTIAQSQIIDPAVIHCEPVEFPPNVYALTATLGADNTWAVVSDILATADVEE